MGPGWSILYSRDDVDYFSIRAGLLKPIIKESDSLIRTELGKIVDILDLDD